MKQLTLDKYFCNVGKSSTQNITIIYETKQRQRKNARKLLMTIYPPNLSIKPNDAQEIYEIIKKMQNKK